MCGPNVEGMLLREDHLADDSADERRRANRGLVSERDGPRRLKIMRSELLRRLDEAFSALQERNRQQIALGSLFVQFCSDLKAARASVGKC